MLAAAGAAIGFGLSYPMTAVALRSWSPLGVGGASRARARWCSWRSWRSSGVLPRPRCGGLHRARPAAPGRAGRAGWHGVHRGHERRGRARGPHHRGVRGHALRRVRGAPRGAHPGRAACAPRRSRRSRSRSLGTLLLAGFQPSDDAVAGIAFGLVAAVGFGLYLVLSRRWTATAGLDGTSITMANMVGRGPVILVTQLLVDPAGVFPRGGPGGVRAGHGGPRAAAQHALAAAHPRVREASPGASHVIAAAAHAAHLRDRVHGAPRRAADAHGARRRRARDRGHRGREWRAGCHLAAAATAHRDATPAPRPDRCPGISWARPGPAWGTRSARTPPRSRRSTASTARSAGATCPSSTAWALTRWNIDQSRSQLASGHSEPMASAR